jgi:hypothetical protein
MQRYFFKLRWPDHERDDQIGTPLQDDAAALDHACRMVQELMAGGGYDDPGLGLEVRNELHKIVLYVPFVAACA